MKKIIKKWGSSFIISLTPEEMKIYKFKESEVIDVELAKIKNEKYKI